MPKFSSRTKSMRYAILVLLKRVKIVPLWTYRRTDVYRSNCTI